MGASYIRELTVVTFIVCCQVTTVPMVPKLPMNSHVLEDHLTMKHVAPTSGIASRVWVENIAIKQGCLNLLVIVMQVRHFDV